MTRILISIQKILDQGGISSSIVNLLNELGNRYDVTLLISGDYVTPHVQLPSNIKIVMGSSIIRDCVIDRRALSHQNIIKRGLRIIRRIVRRKIGMPFIIRLGEKQIHLSDSYDVAIAFVNNIYKNGKLTDGGDYDIVLHRIKAKRKVAWLHTDLREIGFNREISLNVFKDFDAIVNVSEDNKTLLDEMVPEYIGKSFVVYNMYDITRMQKLAQERNPYPDDGKIHLNTVARVAPPKRIDRIVETCRRLKDEGNSLFTWTIVGDGPDMEQLQELVKRYALSDILSFVGMKSNPYPYMKFADAFVLTSAYEGFGMTVREAQILQCPPMITNFGPAKEIVEDGVNGKICENSTEGVYQMIKHALEHLDELGAIRSYLQKHPIDNSLSTKQFNIACGIS